MSHPSLSENEVRALRDRIYGLPTTDSNWEACKDRWMQPAEIQFLIRQAKKIKS